MEVEDFVPNSNVTWALAVGFLLAAFCLFVVLIQTNCMKWRRRAHRAEIEVTRLRATNARLRLESLAKGLINDTSPTVAWVEATPPEASQEDPTSRQEPQ